MGLEQVVSQLWGQAVMPSGIYERKPGSRSGKYERTPEIRKKIADSIRSIAQENAKDPEWRKLVSEGTKKRMHDPDVRERHLAGLEQARQQSPTGSSWRGGQGCEPNELERSYSWLLLVGYVSNFPVHVTEAAQSMPSLWYRLDYALPDAKICFEIDGPTHKHKVHQDAVKTAVLEALGWKVIRIKHWT